MVLVEKRRKIREKMIEFAKGAGHNIFWETGSPKRGRVPERKGVNWLIKESNSLISDFSFNTLMNRVDSYTNDL